MLHIESPHQGIYTPLSQGMTDSDSEEQLFLRHQQPKYNKRRGNRNPPDSLALGQHSSLMLNFNRKSETQKIFMQQQNENFQLEPKFQLNAQTALAENSITQPSSYTTNMQNTFRSVMMSDGGGEPGSSISSFNSDYDDRYAADNVAILSTRCETKDSETNQPMSPARRFCFVTTLFLCFLVVMSFVWLVPCTTERTCPAPVDRVKTHNWLSKYTNIELKGGVNVVTGLRSWENNLIFLYRGDDFFSEPRSGNSRQNGVISLIGSSGAVAWYDEMHDEPVAIDCTLIDIDLNGQPDCLVMDEYGELGIINPISGQWYWKYKERSAYKIDATDFPVILPDLDGDGVLEILVVTSTNLLQRTKMMTQRKNDALSHQKATRNCLRILSGYTGVPIGEGFQIHECDLLRKLHLDGTTQTVIYSCLRNKTETRRSKTLGELFALVTNKSLMGPQTPKVSAEISQFHHSRLHRDNDAQRNIYSLSGRELVVENRGNCPQNCNVTFILSDGRNGKVKVLRNFTEVGMYGMAPVQWHFKNSQPEMSGFVMKFWKWSRMESYTRNTTSNTANVIGRSDAPDFPPFKTSSSKDASNIMAKVATFTNKNSIKQNTIDQHQSQYSLTNSKTNDSGQWNRVHYFHPDVLEYNRFDHLIKKRESYRFSGSDQPTSFTKGSTKKPTPNKSSVDSLHFDTYKMEMITETVILVLFIGADTRIENTSQSNIIQFCHKENNGLLCQPNLTNQENSILIADLDQDGSQELVSFTSTFVEAGVDTPDYKLVTYVRLLRLEAELPAFYSKSKNN